MSYLTVNRGTPNRETPIDVLHPSGANIGGGANRKHWGNTFNQPPRGGVCYQRARKAVLADFYSQHTLGDAGALLAAPQGQGPPGGLEGRPSRPRHGLRAG